MCGILGIISVSKNIQPILVEKALNTIKHRGPDDEGYIFFDGEKVFISIGKDTLQGVSGLHIREVKRKFLAAFGHRRLSILDISKNGHQPMSDESKIFWIIYNGEIYNFRDIRKKLKSLGYSFSTGTDTEVILKSYIEWGENCVELFNGMWAFAILDLKNKKIFISRDRTGVKPLYYFKGNGYFGFASEIKALTTLPFITREKNKKNNLGLSCIFPS